jgi:DNA repair photolyase
MEIRMPPLDFAPPRVYVLDQVWKSPAAARRAEHVIRACAESEMRTFKLDDLPDIVVQEGWDHLPRMGSMDNVPPPSLLLGLFEPDAAVVDSRVARLRAAYSGAGSFSWHVAAGGGAFTFFCSALDELRPNPTHVCRPQWRLHQGRGCPHQCAYCSLGGVLISQVNTEEYIEHLGELLRRNPWQKTWLYDDVMDVPTLEPQLDTLAPLMRFFEQTRDRYLIIHTKSDRVEGFLEAGAPANTIIAWSLSGPTQSRRLEPRTGTTEGRIEAARLCQQAGITVRFKFKPIIPVRHWRDEADYAIELALSRTQPDNLSLTSLMWMSMEQLESCMDVKVLDPDFVAAGRAAVEQMQGVRVGPFPDAQREQLYRHYLQSIRRRAPDMPVTLCTESLAMWKQLGSELGYSPTDYVCGCGAGATPQLQRLQTSPWHDARVAARTDGAPVFVENEGRFTMTR